jgi:hypothetical protein
MLTSLSAAVATTASAVSTTASTAIAASTGSAATTAGAVGSLVNADPTSVEPGYVSTVKQICAIAAFLYSNADRVETTCIRRDRSDILFVVQSRHSRVGISIVRVTNEAEAPAATGVAIFDDNLRRC